MSAFDDNFAYALVSSSERTLQITGVNPSKYNGSKPNWGAFPEIPALYAGATLEYNGYDTLENAFSVVEIANGAFNGRTEFAEGGLVLPNTLVRIGDFAFNGVKINGRLTIPASVTTVGASAFANTLIDELVVENETTSDMLSGVLDATRVASKETTARISTDTSLSTLKVTKANPTFTGTTTIPIALISTTTIANATVNTANITTNETTNVTVDYYEDNVSVKNKNNRFRIFTTAGNLLLVGGVNENAAPIEIVLSDGIYRTGDALVSELLAKLNAKNISWVGGSQITWSGTVFDSNANAIKLAYSTAAPVAIIDPSIVIRTKFVSNGVSYDSSTLLGAMGAMVSLAYETGAFVLAYGNRYGLNFPQPINLSVPTLTVNGVANLDGSGTVSGKWNFTGNKPRYNAKVLATESYTQSKIQIINRSSILSTARMLADIASVIDADPNFAVNALASQSSIITSITSIASVRSTSASSLSTAISTQMPALQSADLSLSSALSTAIPSRVSQMESVSTLLQTAVSGMQQTDAAMSTAMSEATSNRSSQTRSLNSAISTATSLLQNADAVISGGVSTATLNRSLNVSTNASTWSAQVSALETADATLSTSIANVASARISSVAALSSLVSATVPALQSVDATFSTALSTQTTDRNAAVATLSGAISAQVSATQSMNAAILPQIMASATDSTTSTVFNLVGVTVGQSVTFVKSGDSTFSNGDKVVITYSATDYLKGTVTEVAGSSVTLNVTFKATSASETTIYTTSGPSGASVASSTGNRTVSLSNPVFVAGSNFVVTSMTGTLFSSTDTGTYSVNLMDASNAVIATSLSKSFNASQTVETHEFVTAFLLKGATNLKQNFLHSAGKSTQIIVNFSDQNAHTTMKGYAVPYTGGAVQIESNGALQSTRISAMNALSTSTRNALGATTTSNVFNLPRLSIGQSLTCAVYDMVSFHIGASIKIVYSDTDFIKGNVTAVNGYNVTFTITDFGTNKVVSTLFVAQAATQATSPMLTGSFLVGMNRSQNVVIDNIHPAFMSSSFGNVYGIIRPTGSPISSNSSQTLIGTGYQYAASPIRWNDAFVPAQQNFYIEYVSNVPVQFVMDDSSRAGTLLLDGYTTSYTTGTVTMINPDVATIATARSVAVSSIVEVAAQSVNSLQIVTAGISAAISVASSERNASVSSLSVQMTNNVATLSSTAASISAALSAQISNRSSQVLTAMTSLVGAAPASLDTLFEIATTLDAGPALYSAISAVETSLPANVAARSDGVSSVSASLSAMASAVQIADATLSAGISSATSDRISRIASVSTGMSAFISSTHSTHASVSLGISTTASVRQTGVNSVSTELSGMATALQSTNSLAGSSIVAASSARQSGITSASASLSSLVAQLQTANTALSSGISTATSARQSGVNLVSESLSSTVLAQASSIASLSSAQSTLNGGINLSTLANLTEVDSAIGQVLGVGTVSALDTLNEFALAVNNNASIGTTLENAINGKANQSDVALLSDAVLLKANQTDLTQLVNTVGTKANDALVTQLQTALSSMGSTVNVGISSEVQSLQSNMTVNTAIFGLLSDTIRQVDTLYVHNGFLNPNGTINYKLNKLSNMVLQSSSLAFTIDANYAVTKITQVIAMKFDSTQTTVKYSSRGVEYPVSFTGGAHTFSIDSSNTTDYANNATAIIFIMNDSATRFAPDNSPFTVPKLAISGYVYAVPTVQTPYAETTWSDATGKISQVITVDFESGVQRLQIDGTVHDVTGTTQLVHTLEYLPGADPAGAVVVKALNSNTKLESAPLTLNNVYNDYPKHAAPAEVGGSKTVTVSGSTYTHAVTYSTTASTVELQTYNVETSAYTSSELTVVGGQVSVSLTHAVGQIGQPLFKLRAKTGNGKRISEFVSVNAEAVVFSKPVQSNVSYTTLSAGSYRVTATYAVNPIASAVKVINPSTTGTYIASQAASGGSVTFSIDYTETQVTNNAISFAVITLANSYGLQSAASDAFVPLGQYDSPTYANDGSKSIMLNEGGSEYTYSANHNSLSTSGINVYNPDNSFVQTVTGTSPFAVTKTYGIDKIGQVMFKLSSKESATKRESALIDVIGEDIPIYSEPVMSGQITYGVNGANYTAQMNYGVNHRVEALVALKSDGTALPNGTSIQQSISSTTGTSRVISITVTIPNSIGIVNLVVRSAGNGYGKPSANSQTLTLMPQFEAPTLNGSISYSGNTATSIPAGTTNMVDYRNTSSIYSITITGDNSVGAGIWGTTIYTDDSNIMKAAMHSGFISHGETKTVYIVILPGQQSYAASTQNSISSNSYGSFAGSYKFSGHLANMTYNVDSGVTALQVRNATDGSVISGPMTSVSGTTATITVPFTETLGIAVVALSNSTGRESAASTTQTLLKQYSAPTLNGTISYSGNTATSIPAGTTNMVDYRNTSSIYSITITGDNSVGAGIWGTTIYTDDSNIMKAAMHSGFISHGETKTVYIVILPGQQSYAASTQNSISSNSYGSFAGSYKFSGHLANMTYNVDSGVTALQVRNATDGSVISGPITSVTGTTATITVPFTETLDIAVVALANANGRESAASTTQTLLKQYSAPTLNGSISYSGNTATMTYNVAPNVTEAFVKKPTDQIYSVNSITNRQILPNFPVLGEKKTWTYTLNSAIGDLGLTRKSPSSHLPFAMNIGSDRVVMGNYSGAWGGEQTILSGFHNLARPLTFTVSFDGSYFLISYDNNTKTARYPNYQNLTSVDELMDSSNMHNGTWSGPVVERFSSRWEMQIAFNNTGNNNSWRGLIGNVYNGLNDGANRAWGIWINNNNTIIVSPYSDSVLKAPTLWETTLVVAQNVNYVLRVTKMLTTMTISLTNLSTNATQTSTMTLSASDIWGMHGSVTVGGWLAGFGPDSETFVGSITEVSVFPAFASSTVSGNSVTFSVPFLDAELPLSLVAVAKANSNGRVSANSVVQSMLIPYAAPIKASEPVYTEVSVGSYAATMTYTVSSGVTSVQVRRASDNSVVTGVTTSVTGTTATITVPVTVTLDIAVVALANANGRESAASATQTIVPVATVEFSSYINESGTTRNISAVTLAVGNYAPWNSTDKVIFFPNPSANRLVAFRINRTTLPYTQTFLSESNGDTVGGYVYSQARSVIYDSTRNLVVMANTGKNCLLIYNFYGSLLEYPVVREVRAPSALHFDRSGNILVATNETSPNAVGAIPDQIRTYSASGIYMNTLISTVGTTAGTINKPTSLSVDSVGNIIVGCLNGVQIFSSSGVFITRLPNTETFSLAGTGILRGPSAAVDPQNDNRIVALNRNNRVLYLFEKDSSGNWYSNKSNPIGGSPSFDENGNIYMFVYVPGVANRTQLRRLKITDFTISNVVGNLPRFAAPTLSGSISYSGNTASMTYTVASGVTEVRVVKSDYTELPGDAIVTTNTVSGTTATIVITFATSFSFVVIAEGNSTTNESEASATQTLIKQFDAPIIVNVSYSERTVGNYTALTATLACTVNPEVSSVKLLKSNLTAISDTTLALPSSFVTRIGSSNWRQYIPMQDPGNTDVQIWTADAQFYDVGLVPQNEIAKQFSYFAGYWLNAKRASSGQTFSVNVSNGTVFEFTATEDYPVTSYTGKLYGSANVGGPYNLTAQSDGIAAGIAVSGGVKIMNLAASSGSASPKVIFVLSVALPLTVVVVAEGNATVQESAASVAQPLIIGEVTKYVSVGRDFGTVNKNSIAYSVDGLNWTSVANNIFTDYGAAAHHSAKLPRWVAVGQGTNSIAHSINGANWIPVTNSTTIFSGSGRGVAYSTKLSRWVAVGGGTNNIAHSTDGINWVGLGTDHFTGGGGLGVSYGAELSRWVAVGHGTNTSTIVHSTDGITWNGIANSTSIFSEAGLGVAYGGSKWVAVGQGINSIAYSTDGITWYGVANSTSIFSERGQGVAYSFQLSRWVAVGRGTNTIAHSIDGVTWTPVTNSTSIFQTVGHSVLYNSEQSRWVAVGGATAGGSTTIAYSTNGIDWTAVPNSVSVFDGTGIGIATLLTQFAAPTLSGSISYSENTASMTYTVNAGVTEVSVLQADLTPLPVGTTVTTNVVSGTTATLVISSVNSLVFVVVAQSNSNGNESVASVQQILLKKYSAPVLYGGISYSGSTASMTYTVDSGVTALRVVKSDLSALPSDASVTTNAVSGTTATIAITFATSFSFVVIAEGNSNGRESAASVAPISLSLSAFSPRLTSVITYSGNTASMTYAVASGVTAVQVRNASDNSVVSGVTSSVNSLTATITVPYSANISIVVVANSSGQESAPSTILIVGPTRFPAPTSQNSSSALVNNIYMTTTTCQVASGVTAIQANSASATTSVSGTTATIVYASDSPPTSVCALGNGASATSAPALSVFASTIPKIRISGYDGKVTNSITYNATFGSSGTGDFGFNAPRGIAHLYVNTGTSSVPVIRRFLFVSNTGSNNVKVYSNASSNASSLSYHSAISSFLTPSQIACYHKNDSGGISLKMAIADSGNHRIVIYDLVVDAYGDLTINLALQLGSYGSGAPSNVAPHFNNPQGVAYSRIRTLFVADTNNHRIQVVDRTTHAITGIWGAYGTNNGQLNYPTSLAVNALTDVIVGCQNGVQIFTSSGTFVTKISTIVSPSVAVDNAGVGKIIVTNPALNQLHVFSSGGVQMFTMFGGTNGFNNPSGVTVDNYGNIYVCDRDNHRIQYFESMQQVSFFAPMLSSGIAYSGTTASMRYTVAAEASTMEVRKASDNTVISGATYVINGTTANITVPLTTADAPLSIVVVALTNQGVVSAASATLTLVAHFAPALSSSVTYSGNTASMTYTVATGVTGVQVRKASDNTVMSGATYIINGTTATITVPLTDTVNVVVVSLIYQVVSAASVQQTLVAQFAAPTILNSVTYSGNTASMTYAVATGVTGVEVRNALDNSVMSGVTSSINSLIATITVTLTNEVNIVVVARSNSVRRESVASVIQPLTLAASLIANGDAIKYIGNANIVPQYTPLFIQSNPRGNGMEWFAVVPQSMKITISEYASGTDGPFKPTPQLPAVPWNNIVTTLMTDMSELFFNRLTFNHPIGSWDTSNVTNMYSMFRNTWFNQAIGAWNTSAVTNMARMFDDAFAFNQTIGTWNTSAVRNMELMFFSAGAFNQAIGAWNTGAVTNMNSMFLGASAFNQAIGAWNTSAVTDMSKMFNNASAFNQAIGAWNTIAVTNMGFMFNDAFAFNQAIGTWNTSAVRNMEFMFYRALAFNQAIGAWNTSAVTDMNSMFFGASVFNQPIGAWNTSAVTYMPYMFYNASAFNQNISAWVVAQVQIPFDLQFRVGSALSYDNTPPRFR